MPELTYRSVSALLFLVFTQTLPCACLYCWNFLVDPFAERTSKRTEFFVS